MFGLCTYFVFRDAGLFKNPTTRNLFIGQLSFYVIYYMTYYIFFKHPQNIKLYKHFKTTLKSKNLDIIYTKYKGKFDISNYESEGNFINEDHKEKYKEACLEAYETFAY